MTEQDVDIAGALNRDAIADAQRIDKAVARAKAHVALIDGVTLLFARMWTVLAVLLAPLFALVAQHAHRAVESKTDLGDEQS